VVPQNRTDSDVLSVIVINDKINGYVVIQATGRTGVNNLAFIKKIIRGILKFFLALIVLVFVIALLMAIFETDDSSGVKIEKKSDVAKKHNSSSKSQPQKQCEDAQLTGFKYGITGSSVNVRNGPSINNQKIINQKSTKIFGETHYIHVDNTVTVLEKCRKEGWSLIEVVKPDWLNDSHRGWILSKFLRKQNHGSSGFQVFTEEDFLWDNVISPYKEIIISGVNKIHRENARCKVIDPSSAYLSGSKSSPDKPVFYVTCGSDLEVFNVWFSKSDLDKGKVFKEARHINKTRAISLCEQYAISVATHPSTVDFSYIMDLATMNHPNGRTTIQSSFTAKNSFNLEIKFQIRCLLDSNGLIEATINEYS